VSWAIRGGKAELPSPIAQKRGLQQPDRELACPGATTTRGAPLRASLPEVTFTGSRLD